MSDQQEQEWFVYIIEATNGSLYTGITTDIARRWEQHLSGKGARYFRGRKPKRLLMVEGGHDRSSASKREAQIKQLPRRAKLSLVRECGEPDGLEIRGVGAPG